MANVVTLILAGGQGSRLYPLTKIRSKPAVPIAGNFRLIDIPLSNCIHSNLRKIFILTQFAVESLHRHIFHSYRFDIFSKDFVTILAAQQTYENKNWYQGTADAVRQNLHFLRKKGDLVLILSGDHLYRMNYRKFIDFHIQNQADISIAVYPVRYENCSEFGVMKVNRNARIVTFLEKPRSREDKDRMIVPEAVFRRFGLDPDGRTHLASMGIYLFNWTVLEELLKKTKFEDFGREVIPFAIKRKKVYGYFFDGYWEDIGTIRSFFEAHIDLTNPLPRFNFYDEERPIFTHARFLPGAKVLSAEIHNSILSGGSILDRCRVVHSVIGLRSRIGNNSNLERVVMMGADYFESEAEIKAAREQGIPPVGIGNDCVIKNAIIDKNARIGHGVKLISNNHLPDCETDNYCVKEGIIVVPKNAVIPNGTVIQ
ncbi:MAG: glucose-1-phosphate adenylyltransferase [Calditrichia bacterium]